MAGVTGVVAPALHHLLILQHTITFNRFTSCHYIVVIVLENYNAIMEN